MTVDALLMLEQALVDSRLSVPDVAKVVSLAAPLLEVVPAGREAPLVLPCPTLSGTGLIFGLLTSMESPPGERLLYVPVVLL